MCALSSLNLKPRRTRSSDIFAALTVLWFVISRPLALPVIGGLVGACGHVSPQPPFYWLDGVIKHFPFLIRCLLGAMWKSQNQVTGLGNIVLFSHLIRVFWWSNEKKETTDFSLHINSLLSLKITGSHVDLMWWLILLTAQPLPMSSSTKKNANRKSQSHHGTSGVLLGVLEPAGILNALQPCALDP